MMTRREQDAQAAKRYAQAVKSARLYSATMAEELGDWQTNKAGILIAWNNMEPELRARWLDSAIEDSTEYKFLWDCLRDLAAHLLRQDPELPRPLGLWVADLLDGTRERQGRCPESTFTRDVLIALLVKWIAEDCGIYPTRNGGTEPLSACDALEAALNIGHKRIEKAWFEHRETVS